MRNNQPVSGREYVLTEGVYLISRTDLHGRIVFANPAFIEASGFARDVLIGAPHNLVRHPDMPPEVFGEMWRMLKAGQAWRGEVKNRRENGDHYWVHATVSPTLAEGSVVGYTSVRVPLPAARSAQADERYRRMRAGTLRYRLRDGKVLSGSPLARALRALRPDGSLRRHFAWLGALILIVFAGVGALAATALGGAQARLEELSAHGLAPLVHLHEFGAKVDAQHAVITGVGADADSASLQAARRELQAADSGARQAWQAAGADGVPQSLRPQFDRVDQARQRYQAALARGAEHLAPEGLAELAGIAQGEVEPAHAALRQALTELVRAEAQRATALRAEAVRSARRGTWTVAAAVLLAALVLLWQGRRIAARVLAALDALSDVVRKAAAGDLVAVTRDASRDEAGHLLAELDMMQMTLCHTITAVRRNVESLAGGSHEIAAGNSDLSVRTEQQAASLQHTAASLERLTVTVRQNADSAQSANALVREAAQLARQGGEVAQQAVTRMTAIAEASTRMLDIVEVIESIAFQTNILALNAAVEAARAGEQGRGFAVVAAEVRLLAQRSAAAAKEIQALIGDSVTRVDDGQTLVTRAGDAMTEIVAAVGRVTDLVADISTASAEQSAGIEHVNQAIAQMDGVTQQNAALVEQAAAAAASLDAQAGELSAAVSVFIIDAQQVRREVAALGAPPLRRRGLQEAA